jgi:hypothetical protein
MAAMIAPPTERKNAVFTNTRERSTSSCRIASTGDAVPVLLSNARDIEPVCREPRFVLVCGEICCVGR